MKYYNLINYEDLFETSCMKVLNIDENINEIELINWFKKKYILKKDIERYNNLSPIVIYYIEKQNNSIFFYKYIYDTIVLNLVFAINNNNYSYANKIFCNTLDIIEGIINEIENSYILIKNNI